MLSHDEDRHLRAIEQWLETDDPALTRMLRSHEPPPKFHQRKATRITADITGAVLFALGALAGLGALIVLGTMLISLGVCLHITTRAQPEAGDG